MTVAYLKSGMGKKYVEMFNTHEHVLIPSHIVYSMTDGSKNTIDI
jgi:hypothetical protein